MYCKRCGKENKDGQRFCKYCGTALSRVTAEDLYDENGSGENDTEEAILPDEYTDRDDHELRNENDEDPINEISSRTVHEKSRTARQKDQGDDLTRKALIMIIGLLAVVLVVLVVVLVTFLKKGSLNPADSSQDRSEEQAAEDQEDKISAPNTEDKAMVVPGNSEGTNQLEETEEKADLQQPDGEKLFEEFLAGNVSVKVADDFLSAVEWTAEMKPGQEYSFRELEDYTIQDEYFSDDYNLLERPTASYVTIHVHGEDLYALLLSYRFKEHNDWGGIDETYVLYDNGGKLEIKFAIDESNFGTGPTIRGGSVYQEGTVSYGAHDGAGEVVYSKLFAPDSNFTYRMISDETAYMYWLDYSPEEGDPNVALISAILKEAAAGNENISNVSFSREIINNETYYFLTDYNFDYSGLSQDIVDHIYAVAAGHGFTFDEKAAADAAKEAYEKELGVYEICQKTTMPEWIEIK